MVSKTRFSLLLGLFALVFLLILARLFYWQIIRGGELSVLAQKQYNFLYKAKAKRGNIYFGDKTPFVINQPGFLVYANPSKIKDKITLARSLSSIVKQDEASISALLQNQLSWVAIAHKIDQETKEKISSLQIEGLGFEDEPLRFYPEASMAGHLSGFVGSDINGDDRGYFGLEGYYDREIRGKENIIKSLIDALGRPILLGETQDKPLGSGRDLILNIDRTIQFMVENALSRGLEKYGAKGGVVIVMDPQTGAILAMASRPSYDQAAWQKFDEELYKNPAVAASYEPGSTFKVLVMASALNEGVVQADTVCDICDGPITIGGFTIRTWNSKYYKNTTMLEVIQHSDNTGMVFAGKKLGLEKLYSYLENFGIGRPTGIDLEDEESPGLRAKKDFGEIDLATASFGQGIAVTPIQMVRAVSVIANGGLLFEPQVVSLVIKENGQEVKIAPKLERTVISQKAARVMTEMMVNAVDNGEAKFAKPRGYRIAGKTGTAQIPIAGHYDPNKTIASFVGFAPADQPKFVMLVKLDEPTSSPFGSETAAPLFFDIARSLFTYYNIPPKE
ncbi:penicillin-binding protein 2 [Candidatus Microgenomates bacterium]|nr:penicillin-binding protein 2 [Candidatus Microgenomates bacterium]